MSDTKRIMHYKFRFDNGQEKDFCIQMDAKTLDLIQDPPKDLPPWTKLSYHKCSNCPLDEKNHEHCPIAVNLANKIEIVLLNDPTKLEVGKKLKAKVLFDEKPLGNKLVFALNKNDNTELIQIKKRTNENGEVEFKLNRDGEWLLRLVLLQHCSEVDNLDCSKADWESQWAAYTFFINR